MKNRRKIRDRRINVKSAERSGRSNRRIQPDRRLNNIAVEWIPFTHVRVHTLTRDLLKD